MLILMSVILSICVIVSGDFCDIVWLIWLLVLDQVIYGIKVQIVVYNEYGCDVCGWEF